MEDLRLDPASAVLHYSQEILEDLKAMFGTATEDLRVTRQVKQASQE